MFKNSITLALCLISTAAFATQCPQHYFNGQEPKLFMPLKQDKELCYAAYATAYSYINRSAIYSAEHLTKEAVLAAKKIGHKDSFHEDPNLFGSDKAVLDDYKLNGFDLALHLTPHADMPTQEAQYESYSLANIVPQINNKDIWNEIEISTRLMAVKHSELYVISGGVYAPSTQRLNDRIPVPNALFKAIYSPKTGEAGVYLSNNNSSNHYKVISVDQLRKITGIDVFPSLSAKAKAIPAELPEAQRVKGKKAVLEKKLNKLKIIIENHIS